MQNDEQFPHAGVGSEQPELFIRDIEFLNYHIQHDKFDWFRNFTVEDAHRLVDDFCCYASGCYTVTTTELGTGAASEVCLDQVNGVVRVTNAGNDNDSDELLYGCECFKLVDNFPLYAEIRMGIDDVDQADFWFGLINGNSWFAGVQDGVYFYSDADTTGASIYFGCELNGAVTAVDTGIDLTDASWIRLGFHWDGQDTVRWFVFRDSDQYCLATGKITTNICQDEELAIGFGVRNAEASPHRIDVDYWLCNQKRVIE